jgi:hypothetical protein
MRVEDLAARPSEHSVRMPIPAAIRLHVTSPTADNGLKPPEPQVMLAPPSRCDSSPMQPGDVLPHGRSVLELGWADIEADFVYDGTYGNVGVGHTTIEHWRRVLAAIDDAPLAHALELNDEPVSSFQHSLEEVFSPVSEVRYLLKVYLEGAVLHCHFHDVQEIAFNYDASEIDSEDEFTLMMGFLQLLHVATQKDAFVGTQAKYALYMCGDATDHVPWQML